MSKPLAEQRHGPSPRIGVRVTAELKRELTNLAKLEKRDLSEYARLILEAHIAEKKAQARDDKMTAALAAQSRAGKLAAGVTGTAFVSF